MKKFLIFAGVAIIFLSLGASGMYYYDRNYTEPREIKVVGVTNLEEGKPETVDFNIFWQTWDLIQKKYVGRSELNLQAMVWGAAKGLIESLDDPHSSFLTPKESENFQTSLSGKFEGIGIEIAVRKDILTVVAPLEGTPAKAAGLKAGDQIVKIDDKPTLDMSLEEAVSFIRGPKGTTVKLAILRKGFDEPKVFSITRDTINIPSVNLSFIGDDIAHFKIYNFNERSFWEFRQAAIQVANSGRERIIVDVRDNPGGFLESAIYAAGWFLPRDTVVVKEDKGEGPFVCDECRSGGPALLQNRKIVILVNNGSASASEILAGALRDNLGAKLIGEQTFGKGSVQELENLPAGVIVKITVAKWLTPNGTDINEKGLAPDIEVENPAEGEKDLQLEKAIEIVRSL